MPLDASTNPAPAKRSHQRKPRPDDPTPAAARKRSHARKPGTVAGTRKESLRTAVATPKPDANAAARAELDATLAATMARAKTARDRLAVTLWASKRGVSLNEAWADAAKKAAIAEGLIPDYAANPLPVGTVATVYSSALVTIGVQVTQQAPRLNVDAFVADLVAAGVKVATLRRLRKKHTTVFNGAHVITALLATA